METKKHIEETKKHIENVISRTYKIIQSVYEHQKEAEGRKSGAPEPLSRIIYPQYRKEGCTRFSEQELRFVFVEQLNKEIQDGWDVYYSVETPTKKRYKFKGEEHPKVLDENEKGGQSAQFDLVIHDNGYQRIALIEFKANNSPAKDHEKDFVKLNSEGSDTILTYFLEIVKSSDGGTTNNLEEKNQTFNGDFRCWSCSERKYIIKKVLFSI